MFVIDPTQEFALVELERIKWFLGHLDLTKNDRASHAIHDAYGSISVALKHLRTEKH